MRRLERPSDRGRSLSWIPPREALQAPKERTHEDPDPLQEQEVEPPSWVPVQRDRFPCLLLAGSFPKGKLPAVPGFFELSSGLPLRGIETSRNGSSTLQTSRQNPKDCLTSPVIRSSCGMTLSGSPVVFLSYDLFLGRIP